MEAGARHRDWHTGVSSTVTNFRQIAEERAQQLRRLRFDELARLEKSPVEQFFLDSRPAWIGVTIERLQSDGIMVILQAGMKMRFWPLGQHFYMDGFYKYPDGSMAELSSDDYWKYS